VKAVSESFNVFLYPDEFGNTALIAVDDAGDAIRKLAVNDNSGE
jgi:hypothetical protein